MATIWNSKRGSKKISEDAKLKYVSNKCIKQEYQKLFQNSNPVYPVLRND